MDELSCSSEKLEYLFKGMEGAWYLLHPSSLYSSDGEFSVSFPNLASESPSAVSESLVMA